MEQPRPPAGFPTTHWSRVARAGDSTALAALCVAYWYPIYALIRRKGHPPDRALDLTQAYFARLIEKGTIAAADPARGRFRAFLRADCTYFLADALDRDRALKRGGRPCLLDRLRRRRGSLRPRAGPRRHARAAIRAGLGRLP